MDLIELAEFLSSENPGKQIQFAFPIECHRFYEIVMTDGKPNPEHHIECRSAQVLIEDKDPYFQKLSSPHRLTVSYEHIKELLNEVIK